MITRFDPDEQMRLATFAVGDEVFAIDIMRIREIVRPLDTTAVPKAPFGMIGVFNLRGRVLPLFDLRERFGFEPGERTDQARFLIVSLEGRLIGLLVDRVHEVLPCRRQDLRIADAVLRGEAARYFIAVLSKEDGLVLLLNLHRLLEGVEQVDLGALTVGVDGAAGESA